MIRYWSERADDLCPECGEPWGDHLETVDYARSLPVAYMCPPTPVQEPTCPARP